MHLGMVGQLVKLQARHSEKPGQGIQVMDEEWYHEEAEVQSDADREHTAVGGCDLQFGQGRRRNPEDHQGLFSVSRHCTLCALTRADTEGTKGVAPRGSDRCQRSDRTPKHECTDELEAWGLRKFRAGHHGDIANKYQFSNQRNGTYRHTCNHHCKFGSKDALA